MSTDRTSHRQTRAFEHLDAIQARFDELKEQLGPERAPSLHAALVAHDVRSMLAAAVLQIDASCRQVASPEVARRLNAASDSLVAAGALLESLVPRGTPANPGGCGIAGIITREIESRDVLLSGRGIRVDVRAGDSDATVAMGELELRRVIGNVLDNAAKATQRGGTITVSWRPTKCSSWNTPGWGIEITDDGIGFSSVLQTTGMGLAICEALVSGCGGQFEIGPAESGGCRVIVALPGHGTRASRAA
ncbi:MAG: HAMP domain-containing histidine kinase [Phycisphaeraceae bacterium]|nr:HAMP domain-containing histidine kinase [Phycisphaeraceae bacterium]